MKSKTKKRIAATLIALLLIASIILPIIANADNSVNIVSEIGMLLGDENGVTAEYLSKTPTRLQSAIIFLRLNGLEEEAINYKGYENFKDADSINWEEGRNIMAYLKNNSQLGWIGDNGNFNPNDLINAKSYYKVMLESLGYKQNEDFTWDNIDEFLIQMDLIKVLNSDLFTVNDLAIATVETLQAKKKNSEKTLAEVLIANGKIDEEIALSVGLFKQKIQVESVTVLSSTKIEVVYEKEYEKSIIEDKDIYKINNDVEIINVKADSKTVIITVSALISEKNYKLLINDTEYNIKGLMADKTAPKLLNAEGTDSNYVVLTFDKILDKISAENMENYKIKDVKIKSVEIDDTGLKVMIKTSGMKANKSYEIVVDKIENIDGIASKNQRKTFVSREDKAAPILNSLKVLNNRRIELEFKDTSGLNKKVAENENNYFLGDDLEIISIEVLDKDNDEKYETVVIITDVQAANKRYVLTIENICDNSLAQNKIKKEIKKEFRGKAADRIAPAVNKVEALTDTILLIKFTETNALNIDTVLNENNYTLNKDLDIIDIRLKDEVDLYSEDGKTVIIVTTEMEKGKSYSVEISGIEDEFGNELKSSGGKYKKYNFVGKEADLTPPYIVLVKAISNNKIKLIFDDRLDKKSVQNKENYKIDDLPLITKAELDKDDKTIILTTATLNPSTRYELVIDSIKDLSENELTNVKVKFLTSSNVYNTEAVTIDYIEALSKYEIEVCFSNEIKATNAMLKADAVTFNQVGSILGDKTCLRMKSNVAMTEKEYKVQSITDVFDLNNNKYKLESGLEFYGNRENNESPMVEYWEQIDATTFRVIFTKPVLLKGSGVSGITGFSGSWRAVLNPEDDSMEESFRTIDYIASSAIPTNKDIKFNFTEMVTDYIGDSVIDDEDTTNNTSKATILNAYIEDKEKPILEYVEAITNNKIMIVYSEPVKTSGSYKIKYTDNKNKDKTVSILRYEIDVDDKSKVYAITSSALTSEYYYELTVSSGATDIAGNKAEKTNETFEFCGVDIKSVDYVVGIIPIDAYEFKIEKSNSANKITKLCELDDEGVIVKDNLLDSHTNIKNNVLKVTSKIPLLKSLEYKILIDDVEYVFDGFVEDDDISININNNRILYHDIDITKQDILVFRENGETVRTKIIGRYFVIDEFVQTETPLYVYIKRISDNVILYGNKIITEGERLNTPYKDFLSFKIVNSIAPGIIDGNEIKLEVSGDLTNLIALFTTNGIDVKVNGITQISGETVNDFTNPIVYTITAENGTTQNYEIIITNQMEKILTFEFENEEVAGLIDDINNRIDIKVPINTDLTELIASFTTDGILVKIGNKVQFSGITVNDFTKPIIYTVYGDNGMAKKYIVNVSYIEE